MRENDIRRKILLIHNSADIYGASRSLLRLAKIFRSSTRFEILVGLPHKGPLYDLLLKENISALILPDVRVITRSLFKSVLLLPFLCGLPGSTIRLSRIFKCERIDLVHTNTGVIMNSAIAAKIAGAKHIWHIRDWFGEFGAFWKPYSWYISTFSNRVLCVSQAIANQFPPDSHVQVIPNGFSPKEFSCDVSKLKVEFRDRFHLGDNLIVGAVGRIKYQRKGQEYLIGAIRILKDRGISAKCLVVGSPSEGNEDHLLRLRALVEELALQEDVVFTGELEDTRPAFAAMDIAVLPSAQPEPFAGVNMEAMAMGLPVVATNIGGSPDQIEEGKTGLLCKPADAEDLADKLEILCKNPDLRVRMGAAGRERIRTMFSLETISREIEKIYSEVLS